MGRRRAARHEEVRREGKGLLLATQGREERARAIEGGGPCRGGRLPGRWHQADARSVRPAYVTVSARSVGPQGQAARVLATPDRAARRNRACPVGPCSRHARGPAVQPACPITPFGP